MKAFVDNTFYLLVWRAILVALVTAVVLITRFLPLTVALLIAGHIGLLWALVLFAGAERLDGERVVRTRAWRLLRPTERPFGEGGRRWASDCLREQMLRFAKAAAAFAAVMSASALALAGE